MFIFHALACEISYTTNLQRMNRASWRVDKAEIISIWLLANCCKQLKFDK